MLKPTQKEVREFLQQSNFIEDERSGVAMEDSLRAMTKFTYITDRQELLEEVGIEEKEFWDYMSLDDWDYALVFDGYIPPNKMTFKNLLTGCCDNQWVYFQKQDKTVGMAYHS